MSLTTDGVGLTMPVAPAGSGYYGSGNGLFGNDNGAWWLIVLFLFLFAGNGWNRNGSNGTTNGGAVDGYVLASDFAQVERKMDTINSGLCDGFYATAQLIGGVNQNISNGFSTAELSRANGQAALMQQLNGMAMSEQKCCCDTQRLVEGGFANTNYNLATQACETRNTIQNTTRDIIDNQNSNARAILDKLTSQEIAAKDAQIAAQTQQIFGLQLAASQQAQNNYLVNQLRPCPIPAYNVPNPFCCNTGYFCNSCGC